MDKLAIVGIAEIPTGWYPDKTCIDLAVEVIKAVVHDAGIEKCDIGALLFAPPIAQERDQYHLTFCRLPEEMGMHGTLKVNMQVNGWWASPMMAIETAKSLIFDGDVEYAVIFSVQNYSRCSKEDLWWFFDKNNKGYYREWENSYGISDKNVIGLITQRYMQETGLTPEQLASVTVTLRKWAILNNNSRFREDLSIENVLNSELYNSNLHSIECGSFSDGATAFVVTSEKKAESMKKQPVYIFGEGHSGPPYLSFIQKPDKDFTRLGMGKAVRMAFSEASIGLKDIDLFELFSCYPIFVIMQLEELGLCERGTAGTFFLQGHAAPGGKIPVCTNGGIQQGDTGLGAAMTPIIEAVRQLRGEAGRRQVDDARVALVTNFGNQMMDPHVMIFGKELNHG